LLEVTNVTHVTSCDVFSVYNVAFPFRAAMRGGATGAVCPGPHLVSYIINEKSRYSNRTVTLIQQSERSIFYCDKILKSLSYSISEGRNFSGGKPHTPFI